MMAGSGCNAQKLEATKDKKKIQMTNTKPTCVAVEEDELREAIDSYQGWCTNCQAFTHDSSEPDAENYECPDCGRDTVYGAEQALLLGKITLA